MSTNAKKASHVPPKNFTDLYQYIVKSKALLKEKRKEDII